MTLLVVTNTFIFVVLSLLHFYWATGGSFGSVISLPGRPDGQLLFKPGPLSTVVVALGLLVFAFITVSALPDFEFGINGRFRHYGLWIIALIFISRAAGDFKYVGFFKRIKGTSFAGADTKLYSPLSLSIGVISALIAMLY
jgi:hypothetical protein